MELEIRPEPTPEERAAIEAALARGPRPGGGRGAWWEAGLPAAEDEEDEPYASALPRSTRGARRA